MNPVNGCYTYIVYDRPNNMSWEDPVQRATYLNSRRVFEVCDNPQLPDYICGPGRGIRWFMNFSQLRTSLVVCQNNP